MSEATVLLMESRTDSSFNASDTEHTHTHTQTHPENIVVNSVECQECCPALCLAGAAGLTGGQLVLVALHGKLEAVNVFGCVWNGGRLGSDPIATKPCPPTDRQVCYLW